MRPSKYIGRDVEGMELWRNDYQNIKKLYMMDNKLKISSWNVRGWGDAHTGRALRRWMNTFHGDLDVLSLQELKA